MKLSRRLLPAALAALVAWFSAAEALADVKVRRVTLTFKAPPEVTLPEGVKNVCILPAMAGPDVDPEARASLEQCKFAIQEQLLHRVPRYAYIDREILPELLKENPDAKIAPIDALIAVNLQSLKFKDDTLQASATVKAISAKEGMVFFSLAFSKEIPVNIREAVGADALNMRTLSRFYRELAGEIAGKLEDKSMTEEVLLLEAGPLTKAAIETAVKGDLEAAKAKFAEAAESREERNSGYFGLYVLKGLTGDKEGSEECLKKAGE